MVQLTKEEKEELLKILEGKSSDILESVKKKLLEKKVKVKYVRDRKSILAILRRGLREKKNVYLSIFRSYVVSTTYTFKYNLMFNISKSYV